MSVAQLVAKEVLDLSAALLDDVNKTIYTYTVQVPYLQMALQELQELFELNAIPVTEKTSDVIEMDAGTTEVGYDAIPPLPTLPVDMVEFVQLWERQRGIDPFIPMTKREFLPHNLEGVETNQFIFYVWQGQKIKVLPSNQDNDIKIDYIRALFTNIIDETSKINIINAKTFLQYRTCGLVAEFIEHNKERADSANGNAGLSLDRSMGISIKGKQNISTRRRPFRSGYKQRGRII